MLITPPFDAFGLVVLCGNVYCSRSVRCFRSALDPCRDTLAESSLKIRCACTRVSRVRAHTLLHDEAGVWRLTTQGGSRLHTSGTPHGVYLLHRGAMRRRGDPRISYARGSARRLITHNHEKKSFRIFYAKYRTFIFEKHFCIFA